MTRTQRLRRVLILCNHTVRNLAFYRSGWKEKQPVFEGDFGRTVNSNFLDVSVLEWCKLFADERDPHCWRNIATNPTDFESNLLQSLGHAPDEFSTFIRIARTYRDKFIAHLDNEETMRIPVLDPILRSVFFYYQHVLRNEAPELQLDAPSTLDERYASWCREAAQCYTFWLAHSKSV